MTEPSEYFYCKYCRKKFSDKAKAKTCFEKHNVIYFPISLVDLNLLQKIIYTGSGTLPIFLLNSIRRFIQQGVRNEALPKVPKKDFR